MRSVWNTCTTSIVPHHVAKLKSKHVFNFKMNGNYWLQKWSFNITMWRDFTLLCTLRLIYRSDSLCNIIPRLIWHYDNGNRVWIYKMKAIQKARHAIVFTKQPVPRNIQPSITRTLCLLFVVILLFVVVMNVLDFLFFWILAILNYCDFFKNCTSLCIRVYNKDMWSIIRWGLNKLRLC